MSRNQGSQEPRPLLMDAVAGTVTKDSLERTQCSLPHAFSCRATNCEADSSYVEVIVMVANEPSRRIHHHSDVQCWGFRD